MSANPHLRTSPTPEPPVVLGRTNLRGAAGRSHRRHLTLTVPGRGDHIDRTARQVRDAATGMVHELVGRGFDPGRGYHYATECDLLLWIGKGALLTTWPVDCPVCREAA